MGKAAEMYTPNRRGAPMGRSGFCGFLRAFCGHETWEASGGACTGGIYNSHKNFAKQASKLDKVPDVV